MCGDPKQPASATPEDRTPETRRTFSLCATATDSTMACSSKRECKGINALVGRTYIDERKQAIHAGVAHNARRTRGYDSLFAIHASRQIQFVKFPVGRTHIDFRQA